jgi:hypothetical protein
MSSPCTFHTCIFVTQCEMQFSECTYVYFLESYWEFSLIWSCKVLFPLRAHKITWKRISFTHSIDKFWKYALRQNPLVRKMPLVFLCGSMCIAIADCAHDIHVRICTVGKYEMCYYHTSKLSVTKTTLDYKVVAWMGLQMTWLDYELNNEPAQCMNKIMLNKYCAWNCKMLTFFSHL